MNRELITAGIYTCIGERERERERESEDDLLKRNLSTSTFLYFLWIFQRYLFSQVHIGHSRSVCSGQWALSIFSGLFKSKKKTWHSGTLCQSHQDVKVELNMYPLVNYSIFSTQILALTQINLISRDFSRRIRIVWEKYWIVSDFVRIRDQKCKNMFLAIFQHL